MAEEKKGSHEPQAPRGHGASLGTLALGALGVVFGDIGTSPLYTLRECTSGENGTAPHNVLGVLSLIFWALMMVVTIKYLTFIMRADNHGEGGILALLALVSAPGGDRSLFDKKTKTLLVFLGLFGAALLYGDGIITPAISVLSAVEGLGVATHALDRAIVPITCGILIALFLFQSRGTAKVGAIFGPMTLVWFVTIGAIGLPWIVRTPRVLEALNPLLAVRFFFAHGLHGFLVLASVVLCITGGEALYADMGHFGKGPIRFAWYLVVFPALLLNYFGQGALLLQRGAAVTHPFYDLVSGWMLYPLVVIATLATVVASQALISGAFSLTQQAVQLGFSPRVTIVHTSSEAEGQIYVPEVNRILMIACVALVIALRESSALAAAYGIAVTGTMAITSVLFYFVARRRFGWSRATAMAVSGLFLVVDLAFFGANVGKIAHGGWLPIAVAVLVFVGMVTWRKGNEATDSYFLFATLPLDKFRSELGRRKPQRVPGTAVFMSSLGEGIPPVLQFHLQHNKVLHEQIVLLTVRTAHQPSVPAAERVRTEALGDGLVRVIATYGFSQRPNVPEILACCDGEHGFHFDPEETTYYLARLSIVVKPGHGTGMSRWRRMLFAYMSRNARAAFTFFRIPPKRVVEMGSQIEL